MSHEFYYTSVAQGLVKGSRGYCAVAMTRGLPNFLAERLEDLSGYKPLFTALDARNPVNWSHFRLDVGGHTYYVLSRVCAAGLDYTERTNKFAHHVILTAEELPAGGPAWLLQQKGFLETAWDQGEPRWLPAGRKPPQGDPQLQMSKAWAKVAGDAGWAGVLSETALSVPTRPAVVLYEPGTDVLALFAEAALLLPAKLRWRVSFATYAASLPPGENCLWRGLAKGAASGNDNHTLPGALVIDLTKPLGPARGGVLVMAARTGRITDAAEAEPEPDSELSPLAPKLRKSSADEAGDEGAANKVSLASLQASSRKQAAPARPDGPAAAVTAARPRYAHLGVALALGSALALGGVFAWERLSDGALTDFGRTRTRASLMAEIQDRSDRIEQVQSEKRQLDKEKKELEKKLTDGKDLKNNAQVLFHELVEKNHKANQEIATLKKDVAGLTDQFNAAAKALTAAEANQQTLQTKLDAAAKTHAAAEAKMQASYNDLDAKHRKLLALYEKTARDLKAAGPPKDVETLLLPKIFRSLTNKLPIEGLAEGGRYKLILTIENRENLALYYDKADTVIKLYVPKFPPPARADEILFLTVKWGKRNQLNLDFDKLLPPAYFDAVMSRLERDAVLLIIRTDGKEHPRRFVLKRE